MLGKLSGIANAARAKVADVVADVDLSAVKGRISSTVDAAKGMASDMAGTVGDRLTHPADAYEHALNDFFEAFGKPEAVETVEALKICNPYR